MRFGSAAIWLIASLLAAGPAHAALDIKAMRVGPLGILAFQGTAGTPQLVAADRGRLVIDARTAPPADVVARLADVHGMVTGATVDGSRLLLKLAPGVTFTSSPLDGGRLTVTLEQVGPATAAPAPAAAAATAPTRTAPERPRAVPRPVARPTAPSPAADPPPAPPAEPPAQPEPAAAPPAPAPVPDGVEVTAAVERGAAELAFAWPEAVRAAVFQRGDTLWAAFDGKAEAVHGLEALPDGLAAWLEPLPPATIDGAEIFRFRLHRAVLAEATQDGRTWRVRLGAPGPAPAAIGVTRDNDARTLRGPASTRALDLADPDTGERLGALLADGGSLRHPAAVRLVDLELLPAAQGLAWAPLADAITVAADESGFTLSRDGGLRLSAPAGTPTGAPSLPLAQPGTLLGLPALAGTDSAGRQQARLAIAGRIAGLTPKAQAQARLDQVRLLLADGLAPEARATLERPLPPDLPEAERAPVERSRAVLAAAAAALEGQHGKALAQLLEPEWDGDREVALWRAFAAAGAGQHGLAAREWQRGGAVLGSYPMPLRLTLGLKIAESLTQSGAIKQARDLQDLLRPAADEPARARLDLLRGVAATRTEQPALAEQTLRSAAEGGDADTKVRAEFLLTVSRHEQGADDAAAAVAALTAQRPAWRGHPWEARMLRQLGALQMEAGDPLASFTTTHEAATRPGDAAEAAAAASDLRGRLKDTIRAAVARSVAPVTALALHRSYGELLDGDREAPALRRQLAGLAATAGLGESAAALAAGAGGGGKTAASASPVDAAAIRQQLAAATRAGDWTAVAEAARALLARHPADAPLPAEDAAAVVWLALAHARSGAPAEAAQLADGYQDRLPEGPWRALLGLVASAAPEPGRGQAAPAAADALARAVRERLDELRSPGGA